MAAPITLIAVAHMYFVGHLFYYLSKNLNRAAEILQKSVDTIRFERLLLRAMIIQGSVVSISVDFDTDTDTIGQRYCVLK